MTYLFLIIAASICLCWVVAELLDNHADKKMNDAQEKRMDDLREKFKKK